MPFDLARSFCYDDEDKHKTGSLAVCDPARWSLVMGNLISWLFSMAQNDNGDQLPFNAFPWYAVVGLLTLAAFYYGVEGRRKIRWIKDHMVWKQLVLDRLTQHVGWWGGVSLLILICHQVLYYTLFSWNLWMVALVGWGVGIVIYWAYYFVVHHNRNIVGYEKMLERNRYLPGANRNRRTASAR
jgi:hypothetical protein